MSFPRFSLSRAFDFTNYQGGNYTLNNSSWTAVDSTNMQLSIVGAEDDVIELGISGLWGNEAQSAHLEVTTIVSSSVVSWAGGSNGNASNGGIMGWYGQASAYSSASGSFLYRLDAADIDDDNVVTLRLMFRSSGSKTLQASSTAPLHFYAKNLGPSL